MSSLYLHAECYCYGLYLDSVCIVVVWLVMFLFFVLGCVFVFFFFSSRRRHTRYIGDWSSDVCSSDLDGPELETACHGRNLPLQVSPRQSKMTRTGLQRNAAYLVRPDGCGALAEPEGGAVAMTSYLDARQIGRASCRERVYIAVDAGA